MADRTYSPPDNPPPTMRSMAVLFADIAGSTRLYDTLGDQVAKALIDECLDVMRQVAEQNSGRVVKTIGDEVMCVFPDATSACACAAEMQLKVAGLPAVEGNKRAIRIGFHTGLAIEERGDVFGDTVNVAARMSSLAKGNQIMTTRETVSRLPAVMRASTREIAALAIRGKGEDIDVCELIWQQGEDLTMAMTRTVSRAGAAAPRLESLRLERGDSALVLDTGSPGATLGRDPASSIVIADRQASRLHARIERRRDKFFLIDQSTNGTYVTFDGETEIALRREELMLRGSGTIAFGHSGAEATETVRFSLVR